VSDWYQFTPAQKSMLIYALVCFYEASDRADASLEWFTPTKQNIANSLLEKGLLKREHLIRSAQPQFALTPRGVEVARVLWGK